MLEAVATVGMLIPALTALTALTDCLPRLYRLFYRLWYVPAVCMSSALFVIIAIVMPYELNVFTGYWQTGIADIASFGIIERLAEIAAALLASLWLTSTDRK